MPNNLVMLQILYYCSTMKNLKNFCHVSIFFGIITLLKVTDIDAWVVKNDGWKSKYNQNAIMFPDDDYKPEIRRNSLSIYDANWMIKPKQDNRPAVLLASQLSDFHKKLTSKILAEKPGENVIYSPLSVSTILSLMAYGARRNTSSEILNGLGVKLDYSTYSGYHQFGEILKNSDDVVLNFVNQIFSSSGIKLEELFKKVSRKIFNANTQEVDFSDVDKAATEINNWCKKETNNHIKEIVNSDDLQDVSMVLANAIYFEGAWDLPFPKEDTTTEFFHVSKYSRFPVQMMSQTDYFNHGLIKELNAHYIELPYKHKEDTDDYFSMFLLVPREVDGLEIIEKNLDLIDFKRLNGEVDNVEISLPKFKIEQTADLIPVLEKMGIKSMFGDGADFRGISDDQLHVSKMVQKAYLEVDEIGSKAAGVIASSMSNRSLYGKIKADKPFLCAIVVKSLGIPLFFARIADPLQFL